VRDFQHAVGLLAGIAISTMALFFRPCTVINPTNYRWISRGTTAVAAVPAWVRAGRVVLGRGCCTVGASDLRRGCRCM
jgi:hypothetical protein